MSSRTQKEFLEDILEASNRAMSYIEGMSYKEFLFDRKTQDAVIRTLEISGEATKHLSSELREQYTLIPWKNMAGVRDKLIHHYFGVNFDIIWQIVTEELPRISTHIKQILEDGSPSDVEQE